MKCSKCLSLNVRLIDNQGLDFSSPAGQFDNEIYATLFCDDCNECTSIVGDILWRQQKDVLRLEEEIARAARYAKATENPPVPAVFTLDGAYPCVGVHYPEHRWNGWAVPYFTKEEGLRFVAEFPNDSDVHWSYDEANDQFVMVEDQYKDDPNYTPDTCPAQDVHGQQLYSIGGHSYVWDAEKPKTFFCKDHSGRDGHGEVTLIDICSDSENREEYSDADSDDRDDTLIAWALDAEIGDEYTERSNESYTRTA